MEQFEFAPAAWCQHEYRTCTRGCPLESAEGRLREAHRRWHECLDGYQNPDDFRDALNSAIQALRNVTFVLQASKSQIPGFDSWYAIEQEKMKADSVLRWTVNARNRVVKQGDLETHSQLLVKVLVGYQDEARVVDLEQRTWSELQSGNPINIAQTVTDAPVDTSIADFFQIVDRLEMPLSVRNDATVVFERRWVASDIPNYELLALLAHAYGRLRELVSRCHDLLDKEAVLLVPANDVENPGLFITEPISELPLGGRHACMTSSSEQRSSRFRLLDGREVEYYIGDSEPELEWDLEAARQVYGEMPKVPEKPVSGFQTEKELRALVNWYQQVAQSVLRSGQEHGWFSFYFRMGRMVGKRVHIAVDAQGKAAIAGQIARLALQKESDLVIMLGEMWYSPATLTTDGAYVPPGVHPSRRDALVVGAVAKSGVEANVMIPFKVIEGDPPDRQVELDPPLFDETPSLGVLEPTRRAWGLKTRHGRGASFFKQV